MLKINPLSPKILANPLYQLDARRLKRGATPESLKVWSRMVIVRVFLIFSILIVIFGTLQIYTDYQRQIFYQQTYGTTSYSLSLSLYLSNMFATAAGLIFLLSMVSNLFLDFAAISASLGVIDSDIGSGRWDLVRLTTLRGDQIVSAKHTLTCLRSWRMMITIFAMRVLVLVLLALAIFTALFNHPWGFFAGLGDLMSGFFRQPVEITLLLILIGLWLFAYLAEVIWRHRAHTAVTLGFSTGRKTTSAVLAGLGGIFAIWISQGFLAFISLWLMASINSVFFNLVWAGNSSFFPLMLILLASGVFIAIFYRYYRALYQWGLRMIERRALAE